MLNREELRNIFDSEISKNEDAFEVFCKGYELAKKKKKSKYSYDIVSKYFVYDETSPSCVRTVKGGTCGRISNLGYYSFTVLDSDKVIGSFIAQRIVCALHGIDVEGKVVDHIDGDKLNNKITNLRAVSVKENSRNMKIRENNWYGISGLHFVEKKGIPYFVATGYVNNRRINKVFNIKRLGIMPAFCSAVEYRKYLIQEAEKDGILYSDRHKNL